MRYYVGLSLASGSSMDSGLAILDEDNTLIMVDKLYKVNDIMHFFDNFPSTANSDICVSLAWDKTVLNGKCEFCQNLTKWFRQIRFFQIKTTGLNATPLVPATI